MMHADRKRAIRAYINDQIKTRGLMLSEFAMISGIPAPYISLIRKNITSAKLPEKVFTYLEDIYEDNAFQQLLNGDWMKYQTDRSRSKVKNTPVVKEEQKQDLPAPKPEVDLEKAFDMIKSFCDKRKLTFELNFKLK